MKITLMCFVGGLMIAGLLLATGCGGGEAKKSETASPDAATASTTSGAKPADRSAPPTLESIKAPQAFSDVSRQREFEALFEKAKSSFSPPRPGNLIRVEPLTGGMIVGELVRFTATGLIISTPEFPVTFDQKDLKPDNQAELFAGAFAEKMAKLQMETSIAMDESTRSMMPPSSLIVRETRHLTAERMAPRAGPGRHYAFLEENVIFRGDTLRVLDEINDWICVSENRETAPVLGWIPKHSSSVPFGTVDVAWLEREVEAMRNSGFLKSVDPAMNEAVVDSYLWRISDNATIEGIGRLLARYCGHQKNLRVFFVVIKGDEGNRLAEYSESRGFKVF